MDATPNAVELTVDNAWFIAETIGAGTFPWVLAITMPYSDAAQRGAFVDRQRRADPDGAVIAAGCYQPCGRRLDQSGVLPGPLA